MLWEGVFVKSVISTLSYRQCLWERSCPIMYCSCVYLKINIGGLSIEVVYDEELVCTLFGIVALTADNSAGPHHKEGRVYLAV